MTMLLFIVAAVAGAGTLLTIPFLWLFARLFGAEKPTFLRAVVIALLLALFGALYFPFAYCIGAMAADLGGTFAAVLAEIGLLFLQFLLGWIVIMVVFRTTFLRAVVIWLLYPVPSFLLILVMLVPLKLFVMDAYVVPTNAMAPAIIGYHREAECPKCKGTLILSAPAPNEPFQPQVPDDLPGICVTCRKVNPKPGAPPKVHGPDRILSNKLLTPERWDIIVFRHPREPAQKYVMRLVGLPGEKVYVKGDSVWINDVKMAVPTDLSGLEYADDMGGFPELMGTEANPAILGADEYWVLGDFSKNAADSRFWGPVPAANLEGVACMRYWPPARLRVFR